MITHRSRHGDFIVSLWIWDCTGLLRDRGSRRPDHLVYTASLGWAPAASLFKFKKTKSISVCSRCFYVSDWVFVTNMPLTHTWAPENLLKYDLNLYPAAYIKVPTSEFGLKFLHKVTMLLIQPPSHRTVPYFIPVLLGLHATYKLKKKKKIKKRC